MLFMLADRNCRFAQLQLANYLNTYCKSHFELFVQRCLNSLGARGFEALAPTVRRGHSQNNLDMLYFQCVVTVSVGATILKEALSQSTRSCFRKTQFNRRIASYCSQKETHYGSEHVYPVGRCSQMQCLQFKIDDNLEGV